MAVTHPSERAAWYAMRQRCSNRRCPDYKHYGGRGIVVCERWEGSFAAFLADMGPKPTPLHTLERIRVNGNYTPKNCRWATRKEQGRNKRKHRLLTCRGETKCLTAWAEQYRINHKLITYRLSRGWSVEEALETPSRRAWLVYKGKRLCREELSRLVGVSGQLIYDRLKRGWTVEKAADTPPTPYESRRASDGTFRNNPA